MPRISKTPKPAAIPVSSPVPIEVPPSVHAYSVKNAPAPPEAYNRRQTVITRPMTGYWDMFSSDYHRRTYATVIELMVLKSLAHFKSSGCGVLANDTSHVVDTIDALFNS